MRVVLVGCAKQKGPNAAPARELYTSTLYRAARTWAESCNVGGWWILSALHGLVHPDTILEPYDRYLKSLPPRDRRLWAVQTRAQILQRIPPRATLVLLAGEEYASCLANIPHTVEKPLAGLSVGKRLQWFKQRRT